MKGHREGENVHQWIYFSLGEKVISVQEVAKTYSPKITKLLAEFYQLIKGSGELEEIVWEGNL